jgi:hypothetical protein
MAGGLTQNFNLVKDFAEEDYVRDSTGCLKASNATLVDGIGSETYFDRAWIFNGKDWLSIAPMSVARDQPACSLVEMDDGEVRWSVHKSICPSLCLSACLSLFIVLYSGQKRGTKWFFVKLFNYTIFYKRAD